MESEDTKELNEYRVETIGVVSKAWMVRQRKKIDTWNVKAKYQVDGKVYETTSKNDEDMTLTMGDTITVIYSSKTPEMSEIKELEEYYGK